MSLSSKPRRRPAVDLAAGEATANGIDLEFVLPGFPDDPNVPEPVASRGETVDPDHLNTDAIWLWCGGQSSEALATLIAGDIWQTFEGAGFIVEVSSTIEIGEVYELPRSTYDFVVFLVDLHGIEGIPEEYSSAEEESYGTVVFESLPCSADSNELAFTINGALGAETNPGFTSAVTVDGTLRVAETGEPPEDFFGAGEG